MFVAYFYYKVMLNGVLLLLQLIVLNIRKSALKTESLAILLLNFSMTVKVPSKSTKLLIRDVSYVWSFLMRF